VILVPGGPEPKMLNFGHQSSMHSLKILSFVCKLEMARKGINTLEGN
jgi:hypothetical protein